MRQLIVSFAQKHLPKADQKVLFREMFDLLSLFAISWSPIVEAELDISVYFADPYLTWQKGSNENSNGLFRESFLKRGQF